MLVELIAKWIERYGRNELDKVMKTTGVRGNSVVVELDACVWSVLQKVKVGMARSRFFGHVFLYVFLSSNRV